MVVVFEEVGNANDSTSTFHLWKTAPQIGNGTTKIDRFDSLTRHQLELDSEYGHLHSGSVRLKRHDHLVAIVQLGQGASSHSRHFKGFDLNAVRPLSAAVIDHYCID